MCKKLVYLFSFVLVLSLASNAFTAEDPSLIIYYSFDDVGDIIADQSGKGHDGVVNGEVTAEPEGKVNGAAKFASGSYLDLDGPSFPAEDIPTSGMTLAAWIKCENTGGHHAIFNARASDATWLIHPEARSNGEFRWLLRAWGMTTIFDIRAGVVPWGEWVHFAGTYDKASGKAYVYNNGEMVGEADVETPLDIAGDYDQGARVGYNIDNARPFTGLMDEFFLYKRALSQAEIKKIMQGLEFPYAFGPDPADGAMHEDTWATLSWSPGSSAVSHDVYFGENLNDVKDGTGDTFQGNQTATFLIVGFPGFAYPDGLVPGTTYYWRIDEIEADGTIRKGDIWSFTVPPKTAYNPDSPDGAEFVDLNVELSWTKGFGAISHTVYFGDNFDDVNNATGGASQGEATYTPGPLELEKVYYWRVDEFDAVATYKGDIWSFTTPGAVGSPNPSNGATGVKMTATLSWKPGDSAASHQIYLGTDKEAVRSADTASPEYKGTRNLGSDSYDPGKLAWLTSYYWRVDEVNNVNPDSPWKGPVWSFTTADFLTVDDFEDYNDFEPDRIFDTWIDGYGVETNGSTVGYAEPDFPAGEHHVETTIVHSGSQSMPYFYDNNFKYSEASMTLVSARDWTEEGVGVLSLWFYGDASNAAEPMYVALNGSVMVNHDNPNAAQIGAWTEWTIDLQEFADQGVNLANVNTISIGFGDKNNPQAGGSGTMYFDDIRLYRPTTDPSLVIYYSFDDVGEIVADQSGKGHNGVVVGDVTAEPEGKYNGAANFASGSYLDLDGPGFPAEDIPTSAMTLAAWIKIANTGGDHEIFSARASDESWLIHPEPKSSGDIRWLLRSYGGTTIFQIRAGTMTWDEWLHFTGTYDKESGKAALYINGELIEEIDVASPADIAGDWDLGARVGLTIDNARPFTGLMDEFRMYTRALSQDEILEIMQGM
ncbi:MAG: LamG domain-containing protein [Planctomycetota bacterium]